MRAGELGPAVQWAIEHQIKVGEYLGAADFVAVSQAHIMADTESLAPRVWSGSSESQRSLGISGGCAFPPSPIRAAPTSPPRID